MFRQTVFRQQLRASQRRLPRNRIRFSCSNCPSPLSTVGHGALQGGKRLLATSGTVLSSPPPLPVFAPPAANTHDALARLPCPVCGQTVHLLEMETHLTLTHRSVPATHWRALCEERLQLYHTMMGTALQPREKATTGVWARLPTISAQGYQCNWCDMRQQFRSRDDFLRHVLYRHPELELEDVEARVPVVSQAGTDSVAPGPRRLRTPSRRLPGVRAAVDDYKPILAPRQVGISIPRHLDLPLTPKEVERPQTAPFTDTNFPCELCGKCFTDEFNLLQHLEIKHPDGEPVSTAAKAESSADSDVSVYMRKEAMQPSAHGAVYLLCDLCNSSKVYTLPSALFAHIRFKHPAEDAAFHVERLMEKHKSAPQYKCSVCLRCFATEEALTAHETSLHGGKIAAATASMTTTVATSSLPPVSAKASWWCNTCERGFTSGAALNGHMVDKHNRPLEQHPCPYCKRTFKDAFSLATHVTQGHKELSLEDLHLEIDVHCPTCNRYFLNYDELHVHDVRHHHKDPRRPARAFEASAIVAEALLRGQGTSYSAGSQHDDDGKVKPRKVMSPSRTQEKGAP